MADLFAGLAVFSRQRFDEYQQWLWLLAKSKRVRLFESEHSEPDSSRRTQERFDVLAEFDRLCKKHKMGVSLKTKRGLWTPDPKKPINFWVYEPQHPLDKAPRRS